MPDITFPMPIWIPSQKHLTEACDSYGRQVEVEQIQSNTNWVRLVSGVTLISSW